MCVCLYLTRSVESCHYGIAGYNAMMASEQGGPDEILYCVVLCVVL